jgi:L-alanine-DL-glutamate epimerase-like enolase superfamily enzyme
VQIDRRGLLVSAVATGAAGLASAYAREREPNEATLAGPSGQELDRAAALPVLKPDLHYYGGMIRSIRVARMAALAKMPTTVHISGGFGFVYMLHFASCVPLIGRYQEYKLGTEKYGGWFDPPIRVKDGKMTVPIGPGVGIRDVPELLKRAEEV